MRPPTSAAIVVVNTRNGQVVVKDLEVADTPFRRARGLLGRKDMAEGTGLWLEPCSSIHMFFMRFAIDVIYVDKGGRVVKLVHKLRPWRLSMAAAGRAVIELPAGALDRLDIQAGDVLETRDTRA